ncbi:MAG: glycosyltransferase family 4 protein [Bacteroidota bacterium]
MKKRIVIVSEFFHPVENATGYLLTRIADGLAREFEVHVVTGRYRNGQGGQTFPARDRRGSITIRRCFSASFDKNNLFLRGINLVTFTVSVMLDLFRSLRPTDEILVVTNPPSLPFGVGLVARWKECRFHLLVHDVYPEVLIAAGVIRRRGIVARFLFRITDLLYATAESIIVLGRDMHALLRERLGSNAGRLVLIPHWAESDRIRPRSRNAGTLRKSLGLQRKFVVQYHGNMGRTHGIELLAGAAWDLRDRPDLHFLFVGEGAKRPWLERFLETHNPGNITLLSYQGRDRQGEILNVCDIAVIAFVPGMAGISVPSRMYNILAAGKPILGIADRESELGKLIDEERIGWVVDPSSAGSLASLLVRLAGEKKRIMEMGKRARRVAERFSEQNTLDSYRALFRGTSETVHPGGKVKR